MVGFKLFKCFDVLECFCEVWIVFNFCNVIILFVLCRGMMVFGMSGEIGFVKVICMEILNG